MKWVFIFLVIGLVLRIYDLPGRFLYNLDGDLYSWIVKDILVDHHIRLIGQLTSTPGIFIGSLFYYALVPFFWLSGLQTTGAMALGIVLSVITAVSIYYVISKIFNQTTGLAALFLQSILLSRISYDIWVVPTVTSNLWLIWYFYVLVMISKGNYRVLPLLALLISLTWHVSLSLAPLFLALPIAVLLSKKWPTTKQLLVSGVVLIASSLPLLVFEMRHGWSQTSSFIDSFLIDQGSRETGIEKFVKVLYQISTNVSALLFFPYRDLVFPRMVWLGLAIITSLLLVRLKILSNKTFLVLASWFLGLVTFFSLSSKAISEYYFDSVNTILLIITAVGLAYLWQKNKLTKVICGVLCLALLSWSSYFIFSGQTKDPFGYQPKKDLVDFLVADSRAKGYPCIGLSYIRRPGEYMGLRYLIYLENLKTKYPTKDTPIYSVVYPLSLAEEASKNRFGSLGVITPEQEQHQLTKEQIEQACAGDNANLTDSFWGYTE